MLTIDIIAAGRLKKGPYFNLSEDYKSRIKWALTIHEIDSKYSRPQDIHADETRKTQALLNENAFVIVMDEHGNGLRSLDFAKTLENFQNTGERHLQFIIGGADGLHDDIKNRANLLLSFGQQTWPHMLARVMLLEQIYRAQQILIGHPYHRE